MTIPAYKRSERVRKLLHEEISKIVQRLKDPRLGFVTIVDLKLTEDMLESRVFCSIIGSDSEKKKTVEILNSASGFIRHSLGEIVELRRIPTLTFVYDDTSERADRIFSILDKLGDESKKEEVEPAASALKDNDSKKKSSNK